MVFPAMRLSANLIAPLAEPRHFDPGRGVDDVGNTPPTLPSGFPMLAHHPMYLVQ